MKKQEILKKIKLDLGDNYYDEADNVLLKMIEYFTQISSNESHLPKNDDKLEPYIYTAVKSAYLRRGKEGSSSNSEGGLSDSYIDIEEKLRNDVKAIRRLP